MKFYFILFISLFISISCDDEEIIGSENLTSETRTPGVFTGISSEGVFDVQLYAGQDHMVQITANDNILEFITTEIQNGVLILDLKDGYNYDNILIDINVFSPEINFAENKGVGNLSIDGFQDNAMFQLINSGVGNLTIINSSASDAELTNSGVGNLRAFNFPCNTIIVDNSGVGNIELNCSDLLEGSLSGVGNIYYKGMPTISISDTGIGEVINAN